MALQAAFDNIFGDAFDDSLRVDAGGENGDFTESHVVALDGIKQWMSPLRTNVDISDIGASLEIIPMVETELLSWYHEVVRLHFLETVASDLDFSDLGTIERLESIALRLEAARFHYHRPLESLSLSRHLVENFQHYLFALFEITFGGTPFIAALRKYLCTCTLPPTDRTINLCKTLYNLGLGPKLEPILSSSLVAGIEKYVFEAFGEDWSVSCLPRLHVWLKNSLPRIESMFQHPPALDSLVSVGHRYVAQLRTFQLFDITVDYPASSAAVQDLRQCLESPHQRAQVVATFQNACQVRLLHAGANTVDILSAYIHTTHTFLAIDSKGVLLEKVTRPIKRYLKERSDTVASIVSGLLGDENSDIRSLAEFLSKPPSAIIDDDLADPNWVPDPTDAPSDFRKGFADIVDDLIMLFDNREVFVREFVNIFAEQMLQLTDYDVGEIQLRAELLKRRFGERTLQNLDVMVRDIQESKRVDTGVHAESIQGKAVYGSFHVSILSKLCWPALKTDDFLLPPAIETQLGLYGTGFSKLKQRRKLNWLRSLGQVDIELELEDRTVSLSVAPEMASFIYTFHDKAENTMAAIQETLKMSTEMVRRCASFWIKEGVLEEITEHVYRVLEKKSDASQKVIADTFEAAETAQTAEDKTIESIRVYWSYILAMLTHRGALPVMQMHSFLKMVVPQETPYTATQDELKQFLQAMVEEEKLEVVGAKFKLKK